MLYTSFSAATVVLQVLLSETGVPYVARMFSRLSFKSVRNPKLHQLPAAMYVNVDSTGGMLRIHSFLRAGLLRVRVSRYGDVLKGVQVRRCHYA